MDVLGALNFGNHDHVELVADRRNESKQVIKNPRRIKAVDSSPQLGVTKLGGLGNRDEPVARGFFAVGGDCVFEVSKKHVDLLGDVRHLRSHTFVARIEEMDHPRGAERHVVKRCGCSDG